MNAMASPEPTPIGQRLEAAIAHLRAGRMGDAMSGCEAILADVPEQFDALHLLGVLSLRTGDPQRAIDLLNRALAVHPEAHPVLVQLAAAHAGVGNLAGAEAAFLRAIQLAPDSVEAHDAYGYVLFGLGRIAEAAEQFRAVTRLKPDAIAAHNNLGTALGQLERYDDALASFERALALDPGHQDALLNAAQVLEKLQRPRDAVERARQFMALDSANAAACYRIGRILYVQGLRDEALAAFERAVALDPALVEARWEAVMAELPLAYGPGEEPAHSRERFVQALAQLDDWFDASREATGHRAVGTRQPFYLAYHPTNNVALLSRYGELCRRLMLASPDAPPALAARARAPGPVRVAVVSEYFYDHSVWTALVRGWCSHVDPRRVAMHLFHTGKHQDAHTAFARARAASFTSGMASVGEWIEALAALQPDVILYPEIGMDPISVKLASLRLAPAQVVSWGHPQTSGLPEIDYFISAEGFEPADAHKHYSERLVALPNLGCYYEALSPSGVAPDWNALGVDADVPRLVCPGTAYKYLPQHDRVLVDIARRLGRCQFLFFVDTAPHLSELIEARFQRAFRIAGLDAAQFIRFLPWQSRPAFFGLMRDADVYLDTIDFSGFNTAMQAIECGLPVVTLDGRFMRGRLAAGILRRMGMDELVAGDEPGYVDRVVRLCEDAPYRRDVVERIAAQRGVLFGDLAPVRALEALLVRLAERR